MSTEETITNLIKGVPDWHDTINSNFETVANAIDDNVNKIGVLNTSLSESMQQINDIENSQLKLSNTDDMYIGTFFYQGNTTSIETDESLFFYITYDGKTFTRLNTKSTILARDTCSIFYKDKFYLFRTKRGGGVYEFDVLITTDLINWESHQINTGSSTTLGYNSVWAPDLFIDDDGKMYIVYSQEVSATFVDNKGVTRHSMNPYIVEITDLENLIFGTPKKIVLDGTTLIDSTIVKKDSTYYLFAKNDADYNNKVYGTIEIWTSTDFNTWSRAKSSINNYPFEAPSIIEKEGTYYLYIDNKGTLNYGMYYCTSTDLLDWSDPVQIDSPEILRHGSVRKVENIKEKKIILNNFLESTLQQNTDSNFIFNKNMKCGEISSDYLSSVTGKYLKLMTIYMKHTSKAVSIRFALTDGINYAFDNEYLLSIRKNASDISLKKFKELNCIGTSLSSKLFLVDCGDNTTLELYYKIDSVVMPELSILSFNRKYENLILNNNEIINDISSYTSYMPESYITTGIGTINSTLISSTNFECNYVKVGSICIVSFVAVPSTDLSSTSIIATGLPKASRISYSAIPAITNSTNLTIGRGNITVDTNGNLTTFYAENIVSGNYIKGSVTYVTQ